VSIRFRKSDIGRIVRRLFPLAILASSGLFAQDLAGTWQGVVSPAENPEHLRTVLKVAPSDGGVNKANFYSIDQTYLAFPATLKLQGGMVKLDIPGIGAHYEARLSKDGDTMEGTIKAGVFPTPVPWTLKRVNPEEAWALREPPKQPKPLANPDPSFEVATVKLSRPDTTMMGMRMQGSTFSITNLTLAFLVTFAYDLNIHQIIGAPGWSSTERFDITGKPEGEGQPTPEQTRTMLRKLLADRFQLAVHRDRQELPVYTLSVGKSGSKISTTEKKGDTPFVVMPRPGTLSMSNATMTDLCKVYQGLLDRPCVDQTGLSGRYEFSLVWMPDRPQAPPGANPNALATPDNAEFPDLFAATQQQLGLKLDAAKLRIEVLVIDKVEKPSDN
jgi:uncharacterized protein (TIGR03435 family)